MTFGERLQDEAFPPESVNTNKDDRKTAVKVPDMEGRFFLMKALSRRKSLKRKSNSCWDKEE